MERISEIRTSLMDETAGYISSIALKITLYHKQIYYPYDMVLAWSEMTQSYVYLMPMYEIVTYQKNTE